MKKLTARQIEALGIVAANQPLPLYDPEGPIDFKRAFAGHMASTATSLIDRGLVEVIEHREWILTAAGVEAAQAAGFEAKPAAGGERFAANQYYDTATRSYITQILDMAAGGSIDLSETVLNLAYVGRGETAIYDGNRTAAAQSLAAAKEAAAGLNASKRANLESMAMEDDGLAAAELGYERYLENRGADDQSDLAAHDEAWPHGYGICAGYAANDLPCGLGVHHAGDHVGCSCRHRYDDIDPACPIHGEDPIEPDHGDGEERRVDPWTGEELVRLVEDDEAPLSETDLTDGADIPGPEAFYDPGYGYDPEKAERLLAAQYRGREAGAGAEDR